MLKICFIIPCYNEESRLPVREFLEFTTKESVHFCFVNDGSSDRTENVLQHMAKKSNGRIRYLNLRDNRGKAEAVRRGVLTLLEEDDNDYSYIGYLDADLATPLVEIHTLNACAEQYPEARILFGSRIKMFGSRIERYAFRHYLGRLFTTLNTLILGIDAYDTQCGAKVIERGMASVVFDEPFLTRWFFDLEILLRYQGAIGSFRGVVEVPLRIWREKGHSKLKLSDFLSVPWEIFRIRRHYLGNRNYRRKD